MGCVCSCAHTHINTHVPRGYVPLHGRGTQIVCSWWLCELLQRSPPKPFPSGLPPLWFSFSFVFPSPSPLFLFTLRSPPQPPSEAPCSTSLTFCSLSLSVSRSVLPCRASCFLCVSHAYVWLSCLSGAQLLQNVGG